MAKIGEAETWRCMSAEPTTVADTITDRCGQRFLLFFHRADQLESKSRTPSKTGADPPTPPISFRMWREKFVGTVDCPEKTLLFQLVPMETV